MSGEALVLKVFNPHIEQSFSGIPVECSEVAEAKQRVWEKLRKDMENDFRKIVGHLTRGKETTTQAVYSRDGTLLISTEEVIGC